MSDPKKPTMPNIKGMGDMPTEAELDALQAEIDNATKGMGNRAAAAQAAKDAQATEEEIKASLENAGINADAPDAGAAAIARIQELEAELANLKDQALRSMADAENVKKRAEREVAAAKTFGIERFAQDILSVHDNLSRALLTLEGTNKDELGENAKNLVAGIELTEKDLIMVLSRHGVKAVPGVGSKFDPNVHQAVANIPSDEEKGNVANVMQTGFKIGDRTLRAAMVAVSTGPAA
ncbi:molecular chaperone GrpE [Litorimonas taeanensis]|uniref:Protein GrpE n=1 Tax=Litorimonas taeanensis TaxID=568099 RepID=A0A420WEQ7_9PROT|nr:nucleotide exchange factor GrpE [Litorimonas taeanensis]RKQ69464.1 molecular chaperone GrpE [Litorimonas taeanensis]